MNWWHTFWIYFFTAIERVEELGKIQGSLIALTFTGSNIAKSDFILINPDVAKIGVLFSYGNHNRALSAVQFLSVG